MALTVNEEIELINDIISAAISHGGDMGGAYFSDWFSLETAIGVWIKARGLECQYAPNSNSYLSKIQRITMSDIDQSESRYYIAFYDDEVKQFQERGIAVSRPGVPFKLSRYDTNQALVPSFSSPKEKYGYYEVDYRRAEEDKMCVFFQDCEDGSILVSDVPIDYLKKIDTVLDIVDILIRKKGFYIESFNNRELNIRNEKDKQYYIALRKDGTVAAPKLKQWTNIFDESLGETIGDYLNLCKQISYLLWRLK